jgi:hypothetical protein
MMLAKNKHQNNNNISLATTTALHDRCCAQRLKNSDEKYIVISLIRQGRGKYQLSFDL